MSDAFLGFVMREVFVFIGSGENWRLCWLGGSDASWILRFRAFFGLVV